MLQGAEQLPASQYLSGSQETSTVVDLADWMRRIGLDIIGLAALGQDFNSIDDPDSDLNAAYHEMFSPNIKTLVSIFLTVFIPSLTISSISDNQRRAFGNARKIHYRNVSSPYQ